MEAMNHRAISVVFSISCACMVLCAPALAQVPEPMGTYVPPRFRHMQGSENPAVRTVSPSPEAAKAPSPAPAAAAPASAAVPPSMLDKPAEPARIDLVSGRLTIHADNSSLADILHRLTSDSGMSVDGLGADQRIFGSYGPGDPQEVLSSLLDGSGYNVVMLGRTESGTPKELSLSPRIAGLASNGPARPQPQPQPDEDTEDDVQPQPQPASELPAPPPQNGVRTPQQMLQELQEMRQRQLQQQQQQQASPQSQP